MKCSNEAIILMHRYLDDELTKDEERELRQHLQDCKACQEHFQSLKHTNAILASSKELQPSDRFTMNVMSSLPKEKKRMSYGRWLKAHPMITAAAIFMILMFGSVFSTWNQDQQLSVSKQEGVVIEDNTVIVPEGVTVDGDLVVKNGDVKVDGTVDGDVVVVNGDSLQASAGEVTGDLQQVDQVFGWMWYNIKNAAKSIFSIED
ncbi:anti-sigma W factor [Pontibacillus halophilus JSM 076056 = DSM 19796]|uniref:Anti-sigma-W factor RsiW n=1 Tax=Pontibacillus halophilus JSM 076056 = DSM 19796 TaxID=1385510 RepID=A0A0A5I3Y0_9BACI|nr:zf-HC2 domain-containing protein [Pontibacillus halophilus]KGX90507.1 anti-sigma W factor [Pontibacillus halophilus JSM 076056 = DSM 19796]